MTNSIVKFEEKEIELVTIDGVPAMTATQIGSALEISEQNGCVKIYNRHADEFTEEMTRIVKHGRTRVRVFNREGAWLIGMFARTPKAATFRKWVLKALAAHVDGSAAPKPVTVSEHTRALPSDDDIKKFLTECRLFRYVDLTELTSGQPAPIELADFFMPRLWGTRSPNILNKARGLVTSVESPAYSFLGGLTERLEKMKELISYTFKGTPVRTTVRDDCPWFVAADVAKALEYTDATHALRYLDADERATLPIKEGRELNIINESGLYSLILRSRKPEAKAFKKFVTSEVLPSIRKTGAYTVAATDKPITVAEHQRALPSGKREIVLSEKAKAEIGGIVKAVIQATDRPAASVQNDVVLKAINLLSARMENMARFMSAGNTSAAQRECIALAEKAALRADDESGRAFSIPMNKEEYDLICFVRRGARKNALALV